MLELCEILGVTVNELLSGEKIEREDYKKKTEELLVEMAQSEEEKNKGLLTAMWTITIVSIGSLVVALLLVYYLMEPGIVQILVAIGVVIVFLIPANIGLKLEVQAGYYECKNCHHKFIPTYREVLGAAHISTTRYLKCPECGKRTWCKKVLKK
ncbi:MAG: DNA-binding protein [Lachnospiraceae bacterium]|nr:DNA-binding protein [Lachnospiraceae bacterium]